MNDDAVFMGEALGLAGRGWERVSPNPLVGAVVVKRGRIVGRGWHRRCGGPHAEVEAIAAAGRAARGATLYVTLEPCAHHGRTPPCTEAILRAGIEEVHYAAADPNTETRGKGPRHLRRRGLRVRGGLLAAEARDQNAAYFHWRETGRPWVILKWAMSLDGKIATPTGDSRWISGEASRRHAHRWRRHVDAILVGTETLLRDDPLLLPRPSRGRVPVRVLLDRRGRLPLDLKVLRADGTPRLYVASPGLSRRRCRALESLGIDVLVLPERRGRIDLEALLDALGSREISQLLVEGGGTLHGDFRDRELVREVVAFVAPRVIGGRRSRSPVEGAGTDFLAGTLELEAPRIRRLGSDVVVEGRLCGRFRKPGKSR